MALSTVIQYRDPVLRRRAAITPRSIRQTAEIADGIFPIHWPKQRFASLRDDLSAGASAVGRAGDAVTIAPFTNLYVLDGTNDEGTWEAARGPLFHYVNRMGDFYWNMLASNGFATEVGASRAAWAERDRDGAFAAISTSMVREIQVIGPLESIAEQLEERSALGAELQMIPLPAGNPADAGRRLEMLLG